MVVVVFRSRLKPGADEAELTAMAERMYALGTAMPGFISYRDYQSADGESLSLVEFESLEALAAWRDHPEHRQAQEAGRARFFAEYRITVCQSVREHSFP
jgi:heme-degrading monooxygenase HmoA